MFKNLLFLIAIFCMVTTAKAQKRDTILYYFRYDSSDQNSARLVKEADSASFTRVVLPADPGDSKLNVREYYADGHVKLIGKAYTDDPHDLRGFKMLLTGDCVRFFPNGKRSHVIHYNKGYKEGDEYQYYPNGKLYARIKNTMIMRSFFGYSLFGDCYSPDGKMICNNGDGRWIMYSDDDFKAVSFEGPVLNGLPEGAWHGQDNFGVSDSIRYSYNYHKGQFINGVGIDKEGVAHPFKDELIRPRYKEGESAFRSLMRKKVTHFNDSTGQKLSLDNLIAHFFVEENGKITNIEISGNNISVSAQQEIAKILSEIEWVPAKYVGITVRSRVFSFLKVNVMYSAYQGRQIELPVRQRYYGQ